MSRETHRITVDGFTIGEITLPRWYKQEQRDEVRREIAKENGCPVHYIRLVPIARGS